MKEYYRRITVGLPNYINRYVSFRLLAYHMRDYFFLIFVLLVFAMLQILVILNNNLKDARTRYEVAMKDYRYWISVSTQFPAVPDIQYNASLSAYKVGERGEALRLIGNAIAIDPLFEKAHELKSEILLSSEK